MNVNIRNASKLLVIIGMTVFSLNAETTSSSPRLTYLDTLNKGKEIAITPADFGIEQQAPQPAPVEQKQVTPAALAPRVLPDKKQTPGIVPSRYKIQVVAGAQEDMVKKEKATISARITQPMTISFEPPYYKLFVGDFAEKPDAEAILAQIKALGYNDAWIVRIAAQ